MQLTHVETHIETPPALTKKEAFEHRDEVLWNALQSVSVAQAVETFLNKLESDNTKACYYIAFKQFFERKLLNPNSNLQQFSLINVNGLGDAITQAFGNMSEATKQLKVAAFSSFTSFLERATGGVARKMVPNRHGVSKTFKKIRSKAKTEALTKEEWTVLFEHLKKKSFRDYLIAKMLLGGCKRISEVLSARVANIDWKKGTIAFKQLKTRTLDAETVITFPQSFLAELKSYLVGRREGFIFQTKNGKPVNKVYMYTRFREAAEKAKIGRKVGTHTFRCSGITKLLKTYSSDQIRKITGHETPAMVAYYDKSEREDNISKEFSLI